MKKLVLAAALCLPLMAAEPAGFAYWSGAELKGYAKKLAPKMNQQKVATEQFAKWGNHLAMYMYRESDGEAEVHEKVSDVFIVQGGAAVLVVGGKVVGGKSTGPGEIRGKSIEGGVKKTLAPGDVVHIPANTPHQTLLAPGSKSIAYMIVKVEQ